MYLHANSPVASYKVATGKETETEYKNLAIYVRSIVVWGVTPCSLVEVYRGF
jgi:hypothetical protein